MNKLAVALFVGLSPAAVPQAQGHSPSNSVSLRSKSYVALSHLRAKAMEADDSATPHVGKVASVSFQPFNPSPLFDPAAPSPGRRAKPLPPL